MSAPRLRLLVDVSLDLSLESWIRKSGHPHRGVLLLRLEEQSASASVPILSEILERHAARLQGSFAVYQNGHLRIRQR
jgi:hypothetical protein